MKKPLTEGAAKRMFTSQRHGANKRGIAWEFTFDQWLLWWGDDLRLRGTGAGCLQMQRIADSGPYAAANVIKGRPADNRATHKLQVRNRKVAEAASAHQAALDAAPVGAKDEPEPEEGDPSLGYFTMWDRIERDAVRSCDWEEPNTQRRHYEPCVGNEDER